MAHPDLISSEISITTLKLSLDVIFYAQTIIDLHKYLPGLCWSAILRVNFKRFAKNNVNIETMHYTSMDALATVFLRVVFMDIFTNKNASI